MTIIVVTLCMPTGPGTDIDIVIDINNDVGNCASGCCLCQSALLTVECMCTSKVHFQNLADLKHCQLLADNCKLASVQPASVPSPSCTDHAQVHRVHVQQDQESGGVCMDQKSHVTILF